MLAKFDHMDHQTRPNLAAGARTCLNKFSRETWSDCGALSGFLPPEFGAAENSSSAMFGHFVAASAMGVVLDQLGDDFSQT